MKKKLEADLISIAHRILQLKNKSEINQLYLETQKLYEKLSVLRFMDEHFSDAKPTIGITEIRKEIESIFDTNVVIESETHLVIEEVVVKKADKKIVQLAKEKLILEDQELAVIEIESILAQEETITNKIALEDIVVIETIENPLGQTQEVVNESDTEEKIVIKEEIVAVLEEEIEAEVVQFEEPFEPAFELSFDKEVHTELEDPKKGEVVQISFEDLLGGNYHETLFVKKQQPDTILTEIVSETPQEDLKPEVLQVENLPFESVKNSEPKAVSLNDKLAKGITIDLNDRLAFIKHLFGNSSEDYNRVLSQLITFDTFYETRDFVQEMVKPDYNNWEGKQDYEERFMDIIEKKFL